MRGTATKALWVLVLTGAWQGALGAAPGERGAQALSILDQKGQELGWYGGSYALLIGNGAYANGWQRLETVPRELAAVKAVLQDHGFVVEEVTNTKAEVLARAFKTFIDRHGYDRDNRLLFYFAGHGHTRDHEGKAYLVPVDAPLPARDERGFLAKALSMGQIMTWAKQIEAKHALFLFDSCFSGAIFKTRSGAGTPPHIAANLLKPVRQFITAGSASEQVPAQSVFSPLLVKALRGAGDLNQDGYVTGTELGMYLRDEVLARQAGQTPQYGKIRDPELDEGDFLFDARFARATTAEPRGAIGAGAPSLAGPLSTALPKVPRELEKPILLRAGKAKRIESIETVISIQFRQTLGSGYAEVVVSPRGGASRRIAARSAGATGIFTASGWQYELQVVTLDEAAQTAEIMIRRLSAL